VNRRNLVDEILRWARCADHPIAWVDLRSILLADGWTAEQIGANALLLHIIGLVCLDGGHVTLGIQRLDRVHALLDMELADAIGTASTEHTDRLFDAQRHIEQARNILTNQKDTNI
jgi:hypothetical protein